MKKQTKLLISTFIISALLITIIYALTGIYPFGNKTILTMDMSGQYINFLEYFKNVLLGKASLFYNFSMNLGSNVFGVFAYYAGSPLNLILLFFNKMNLTEGILILNILKIALASTTMAYLLYRTTKNKLISILCLSLMYGLISYNIVYSQNIMWIDTTILLPLIILGIENILSNKSNILFIISFFLSILANYYTGYMVGIFIIIYIVIRLFQKYNEKKFSSWYKNNKIIIWNLIKSLIITVLLSSIILVPVLLNLISSKMDIQQNSFQIGTYYHPITAFSKFIIGAFSLDQLNSGPPNIYCGIITIFLVFLYFNNKKIDNRERVGYILLLSILGISYIIIPFNLIFHMLQEPVWFTFRDAFLFSFTLIIVAAKSLEVIEKIEFNDFFKTNLLLIFIIILLCNFNLPTYTDKKAIITIFFLVLTSTIIYYLYKKNSKLLKVLFVISISIELILNGYLITRQMNYVNKSTYQEYVKEIEPIINKYKASNKEFYRIKNNWQRTQNDSFLYNYEGYTHYSSLNGKSNKEFLTNYGIRDSIDPGNSTDISIVMQSLLGIKYYISQSNNPLQNKEWYDKIEGNILMNKYYLNIGYVSNRKILDLNITASPIKNQNNLIKAISGIQDDIFEEVNFNDLTLINKEENEEWYIEYSISNTYNPNEVEIYYDDNLVKDTSEINKGSNNVIYVPKSIKNIKFKLKSEKNIKVKIYKFNYKQFVEAYNIIKNNQLKITKYNKDYLKGNIKLQNKELIVTSIIDDPGWKVKIDGKIQAKQKISNNLIAFYVPSGKHEIEFVFIPQGLSIGIILFLIGTFWIIKDNIRIKNKIHK